MTAAAETNAKKLDRVCEGFRQAGYLSGLLAAQEALMAMRLPTSHDMAVVMICIDAVSELFTKASQAYAEVEALNQAELQEDGR